MGSDYLIGTVCFSGVIKRFLNQREVVIAQYCKYTKCH